MQLLQFSMVVKALTEIHFYVNPHFYNTMFCGQLRLVFLHELKIEVLLFGDDTLTEMQNLQIFKSVQLYIKRTKRFTHIQKLRVLSS